MATSATDIARLHFPCPFCGKGLKAEAAKAGRKARCNGCGKAVSVPGLSEPPPRPPLDIADLQASRQPLDEVDLEADEEAVGKPTADLSAGPASLYLGGVNLILFLSVAISAGLFMGLGWVGAALLGALCLSGLLLAWRGWRLATQARALAEATGQGAGYAIAGRWSHGLIAANYVCIMALAGAMLYLAETGMKGAGGLGGGLGGLGNIGDLLKPLMEQKKEADKLIDEINKR